MENDEEKIKVLYNNCYGRWGVSDKAQELYNIRMKEINPEHNAISYFGIRCSRDDPILVQIYEELGYEFNGEYSNVGIEYIPKKYENYYTINEYDGSEEIEIDYIRYEFDKLKENINKILISNISNDDKIALFHKHFLPNQDNTNV